MRTRPPLHDIELAASIAGTLHTCAANCSVIVGVSDGTVTLEGTVDTADRVAAIEGLVRRFPGVGKIANLVTVAAASPESAESHEDRRASE